MAEVMKAKEVSEEFFGGTVSYWKLLELAKAGKIPHFRVGGRVLFRRSSLEGWLAEQEVASTTQDHKQDEAVDYGTIRKIR